jgi:hypothetical protein
MITVKNKMKKRASLLVVVFSMICFYPQVAHAQIWGPPTPFPDPDLRVWCMAEMNNELYVGGEFTMIGGVVANHIAKWNGSSWSAVGAGLNDVVTCMIVHNNKLYVGHGDYSNNPQNMEVWNGSTWTTALSGAVVYDFCIFNGQVIAATNTGLKIGTSQTWANYGTQGGAGRVCVYNNEVYATNSFGNGISKWNGTTWVDVAGSVASPPEVYCMEVFNNKLIVGGRISSLGGITVYDIAQYDGNSWSNVGFQDGWSGGSSPGVVTDLHVDGSFLYIHSSLGYWSNNNGGYWSGVNRWDGNSWQNVGSNGLGALDMPAGDVIIRYNTSLIVGGMYMVVNLQTSAITLYLVGLSNYFTGLEENLGSDFSIYPNPSTDNITVTWENADVKTLTLLDATGRAVRTYNVTGTQAQLSLDGLANGVYFLSVGNETNSMQKIVKL